jgi:hypothetical protein
MSRNMIARHQRFMRNGYSIPNLMWWMFWPLGAVRTVRRGPETVQLLKPEIKAARIERQYAITNRDEWMALMLEFGVVRPS